MGTNRTDTELRRTKDLPENPVPIVAVHITARKTECHHGDTDGSSNFYMKIANYCFPGT